MEFCKNCNYSLDITKNNILQEDTTNIKTIAKPDELVKIYNNNKKLLNNQYIINFNEQLLKNYLSTLTLDNDAKLAITNFYKQILKQQRNISNFYFICSNCNITYVLQPSTLLYSINFDTKLKTLYDDDVVLKCQDPILPRTKDYICSNPNCDSIINPEKFALKKEAVFYRNNKDYNLKYICCLCHTQWSV